MSTKQKITYISFFIILILLLTPICWVFSKDYSIDLLKFTEEWYKIILSAIISTLCFGVMAVLISDFLKNKIQDNEILHKIKNQKELCKNIISNIDCHKNETIKIIEIFLQNHEEIVLKHKHYLLGKKNSDNIIAELGNYIHEDLTFDIYEICKQKIKDFCDSFIS